MNELDAALRVAIAALIGLGVGIEREWSGRARGADARFAGVRTFLLLGALGGIAGLLAERSQIAIASVLVAGAAALSVAAYVATMRRAGSTVDGTTESAAILIVALGVVTGIGWTGLAGGVGALVVLALREKAWLHTLIERIDEAELRTTIQFAVLALVVLPLLPEGPFGGTLEIRPRALWIVVLLFSGMSYAGHLARKMIGPEHGYLVAGAIGGAVSSTAVTLTFARRSRKEQAHSVTLARGIIAASGVLAIRILIVSCVLNVDVAQHAALLLAPQAVVAALFVFVVREHKTAPKQELESADDNPLRLGTSLQMAIGFQIALVALHYAQARWGTGGVYASGALMGLTDMDALTYSMNREAGVDAAIAARVLTVGVISNSVLKGTLSVVLGSPKLRVATVAGFVALIAAETAVLMFT